MYRLVFSLENGQIVTHAKRYERDREAKKALREIHDQLLSDTHIIVESGSSILTGLMIVRSFDVKSVEIKRVER